MTRLQEFVADLRARGVSFEPIGDQLAIDPVEKLKPDELELVREYKAAILVLLAAKRVRRIRCRGEECDEIVTVIDGTAYCKHHGMSIRFVEDVQ